MNSYNTSGGGFIATPPITKNLIIINVIFFIATLALGDSLIYTLELLSRQSFFEPYQVVTHMFMHGGFEHHIQHVCFVDVWKCFGKKMGTKTLLVLLPVLCIRSFCCMGVQALEVYNITGHLHNDIGLLFRRWIYHS